MGRKFQLQFQIKILLTIEKQAGISISEIIKNGLELLVRNPSLVDRYVDDERISLLKGPHISSVHLDDEFIEKIIKIQKRYNISRRRLLYISVLAYIDSIKNRIKVIRNS